MHFVIIAKDATTAGTLEKRLSVRETHMQGIKSGKASGTILDGGAILDEAGDMRGSAMLVEFNDRVALDAYLSTEIYATNGVWEQVEIYPIRRIDWDKLMAS